MAKNILRRQFDPMYGKNKPYHTPESLPNKVPEPLPIEQPPVSLSTVILFTLLLLFGMLVYLNRDKIYTFLQKVYHDFKPSEKIDKLEEKYHELTQVLTKDPPKPEIVPEKPILNTIEEKEKQQETTEKKQESGVVHQIQEKIQEKINKYSNEQNVKGNGFCYIGYDKNQRECTNVYEGDICMSGQVFPTMAVCLNPHLRP
jgi:hypothetical protein